jgi:NAD(P)H-dependent flavin oxidoreductase YrpB (nitropropane dioxygenase family)
MTDQEKVKFADERSAHTFHIPVLGTGFSIDTPLKVAKYGISSVISLVDDVLIEQVRKYHCTKNNEPYEEITNKHDDARAKRITAYLNLVDKLVHRQVKELQASPFEENSEITKYYEMLPDSPLKESYYEMLKTNIAEKKTELQAFLRKKAVPGSIDVNIMTKLDAPKFKNGEPLPHECSDAMAALRGYGESTLKSAIVFSAGINQYLYSYISEFKDFFCGRKDELKKKIILKVSDYRSAVTQGKFLAKKGLWVSEFRIESGLNCGGHAFASKGLLMGPIMDEFKKKRDDLVSKLHDIYNKALVSLNLGAIDAPHQTLFTVQGGICTSEENHMLQTQYGADATGWGTSFLLVPECVNIDDETLDRLCEAGVRDTELSKCSPVGIPYWNLKTSASEVNKQQRITDGTPGAPCPKGYITWNDEVTTNPVCTASKAYQSAKLKSLNEATDLTAEQKKVTEKDVLAKACICHELGGSTTINLDIDKTIKPNVCPGPIIGYFTKPVKLDEMVDHIYGRISLLKNTDRPHMFIEELRVYFEHLCDETERARLELSANTPKYLAEFQENLLEAIQYYRETAGEFMTDQHDKFIEDLNMLQERIEALVLVTA